MYFVSSDDILVKSENSSVKILTGLIDLKIGSVFRRNDVDSVLLSPSCDTTINLVAAFGESVQATLVNLPCSVRKNNGSQSSSLILTCAVTDKLHSNCILTSQDYNK